MLHKKAKKDDAEAKKDDAAAEGIKPAADIDKLLDFNTPQITNVTASYPGASTCLGLYNPWKTNWYTDTRLRCIFPEVGRTVGYAVTCIYGAKDPTFSCLVWPDVLDVLQQYRDAGKPTILVIKHNYPEDVASKAGLVGGNMATMAKTMGCRGVLCDGPARDFDELRELGGFQLLCTGASPGHGPQSVQAIQVPVSVCGMDVCPGEIIHMDENGATKLPADRVSDVHRNATELQGQEDDQLARIRECKTVAEMRQIMKVSSYGDRPK